MVPEEASYRTVSTFLVAEQIKSNQVKFINKEYQDAAHMFVK